ncbi:hypothetical protein RY831_25115 [Noviherbaspirillum sp. CPCC 100848]|uniref:Uncharacterized protein n=1 Tax=Noviherbaspirillum album TaxID=3080276 RepID=A0ABU6JFJ9_9BURK|nr:hypothetical protein [Noviherbaspirillum sp. CPCC 100848]MEC4722449.1 hypothetical protein [Noviherbaspirillum sp. CPCC 100848]
MANTQPSQPSNEAAKSAAGRFTGQTEQQEQVDQPMQSAPSLSHSSDDDAEDGRYSVAEEQNFDQQSDQARRIGQMPADEGIGLSGLKPSEAVAQSAGKDSQGSAPTQLEKSMDRAVPKADDAG